MLFLFLSYIYIGDSMLDRLSNYVNDREFRFTIYENKIHFINYQKIISIENNLISLKSNTKKIIILGNNLRLKKLLKEEMLVIGNIEKIEVIND